MRHHQRRLTAGERIKSATVDKERKLWDEVDKRRLPTWLSPSATAEPQFHPSEDEHREQEAEDCAQESGRWSHGDGSQSLSTWGLGWKTITNVLMTYFGALIVAVINIVVFLAMDGRRTSSAPQTYMTAFSVAMASLFHILLSRSLTAAFTQHFWRVVRQSFMKVMTLERVQQLQRDPKMLLRPSVFAASKVLYAIAVVTWLLPIAVIFPPGGLEVIPQLRMSQANTSVPIYDSSYVGASSLQDAAHVALADIDTGVNWGMADPIATGPRNYTLNFKDLKTKTAVLAKVALSSAQVVDSSSPCGENCTYNFSFRGPYFDCDENVYNETISGIPAANMEQVIKTGLVLPMYYAESSDNRPPNTSEWFFTAMAHEVFGIYFLPNITSIDPNATDTDTLTKKYYTLRALVQTRNITCRAASANYDVGIYYTNGQRSMNYTTNEVNYNISFPQNYTAGISVGGPCENSTNPIDCQLYQPIAWTDEGREYFMLSNIRAIFRSIYTPISGGLSQWCARYGDFPVRNFTLPDSNKTIVAGLASPCSFYNQKHKVRTIVGQTAFNADRNGPAGNGIRPIVTKDLLNEAVFNVTMSLLYNLDIWHTNTTVNVSTYPNCYKFSRPLNVFLPFFILLGFAFPLICVGIYSLRANGVPAISDSFLQVLMTTAGNDKLRHEAAAGCLGGTENIPRTLAEMKVKYGDLGFASTKSRDEGVRIAGFGTEDEVAPLQWGGTYGLSS